MWERMSGLLGVGQRMGLFLMDCVDVTSGPVWVVSLCFEKLESYMTTQGCLYILGGGLYSASLR